MLVDGEWVDAGGVKYATKHFSRTKLVGFHAGKNA
jgi:hypothetical protein